MNEEEIQAIINKAFQLGFIEDEDFEICYTLQLGRYDHIWLDVNFLPEIKICDSDACVIIRKVESPEDLEMLFNAIVPEKYRINN